MTWILSLWRWFLSLFRPANAAWRAVGVDDEPPVLRPHTVYLVGDSGRPWKAMLLCPCGCGETIELNLTPPGKPLWTLRLDADHKTTIHPSVWRKVGCRSHFWIRSGAIEWARD